MEWRMKTGAWDLVIERRTMYSEARNIMAAKEEVPL